MQNRPSFFTVPISESDTATSTPLNAPMTEFSMTWVAVKVVPPPVRSTVNNELEHEPAKMKYMMPKRVPAATIWASEAIVQSTTAPGSKFRVMSDPIPSPSSLYISTDPVLKQKTCWEELSYEHPFTLRSLPPLSVTWAAQASGSNVAVSMAATAGDVAVGVHAAATEMKAMWSYGGGCAGWPQRGSNPTELTDGGSEGSLRKIP